MIARVLAIGLVVAACGRRDPTPERATPRTGDAPHAATPTPTPTPAPTPTPEPTPTPAPAATATCEPLPFADTIAVAEASGTARMKIDGKPAIVVAADSGNEGEYVIIDPDSGAVRESGSLPLGKLGDDIEGLATRDGKLVGITSSGWIRVWERVRGGFSLVEGPYAVGPDGGADPLSCKLHKVNCAKDYEGLCLRSGPVPDGECVGLAASKTDGALYCVTVADGKYIVERRTIPITDKGKLSGCDIADDGAAWAGTNMFGFAKVYRITGWTKPESAVVKEVAAIGDGFPESIAVGPGNIVYRFSDLGGSPSAVAKFRCTVGGR